MKETLLRVMINIEGGDGSITLYTCHTPSLSLV